VVGGENVLGWKDLSNEILLHSVIRPCMGLWRSGKGRAALLEPQELFELFSRRSLAKLALGGENNLKIRDCYKEKTNSHFNWKKVLAGL